MAMAMKMTEDQLKWCRRLDEYTETFHDINKFTATHEYTTLIEGFGGSGPTLELGPNQPMSRVQLNRDRTPLSEEVFEAAFPEGRKATVKVVTTVTFEPVEADLEPVEADAGAATE
jgi:hypothetical protein